MTLQADHRRAVTLATLVVLAMFLFGSPPPVAADSKLVITSAVVDFDFNPPRITVFGDFSDKFGKEALVLTLDGEPLELLSTLLFEIEAKLPAGVAGGTHRVAVCREEDFDDEGCPEVDSDEDQEFNVLDVTFGAVGPQGDKGEDGQDGAAGKDGTNGTDGTSCTMNGSVVTCANGSQDVRGPTGAPGAPGADGQSCDVTECSAEGVAQIICGDSAVKIACIPPPPKIVFLTSEPFTGALGGLTGADAKCQAAAGRPGSIVPFGTYLAWLSDSTGSPSTRFMRSPGNYELPDGTTVALNYTALTARPLLNSIIIDENGETRNAFAWTNTTPAGLSHQVQPLNACSNWSAADQGIGLKGLSNRTDAAWTSHLLVGCGETNHLYCFQQ